MFFIGENQISQIGKTYLIVHGERFCLFVINNRFVDTLERVPSFNRSGPVFLNSVGI